MVEVTRRQTLALGAGAFLADLLAAGAVRAAAKDTLTIAYSVNLPSFDPTDGPSAVNPNHPGDLSLPSSDQYISGRARTSRSSPAS